MRMMIIEVVVMDHMVMRLRLMTKLLLQLLLLMVKSLQNQWAGIAWMTWISMYWLRRFRRKTFPSRYWRVDKP